MASEASSSSAGPEPSITTTDFTLFPHLPPEIRIQIWKAALTPRIVKWRVELDRDVFAAPPKSLPLMAACQESREAAFEFGQYVDLSREHAGFGKTTLSWVLLTPIYFSPIVDYLFFDPRWVALGPTPQTPLLKEDALDSLLPKLSETRNIMVHPNYTDERKRPTTRFVKLTHLKRILVAADEKTIGLQSKFMLSTAYDVKMYYNAIERGRDASIKLPHIEIGCLGWTGVERRKMHHEEGDDRKLVAIFKDEEGMKAHLRILRKEEWRFTQEQREGSNLKFKLKMKEGQESERSKVEKEREKSIPTYQEASTAPPPEYSETPGSDETTKEVGAEEAVEAVGQRE